mmetsp:Transcript_93318/g.273176  ORF Transcript_93318/g.273176 Transcript_93318/m.273176 type:complete len:221 (-) Transcript_93318:542-1204(-)
MELELDGGAGSTLGHGELLVELLDGLGVAADGLVQLRLELRLLQVRVPHDLLHGFQLAHRAVQLLAQPVAQAVHVKAVVVHGREGGAGSGRVLEELAKDEGRGHVLPRVEAADQQRDEVTRGPRERHKVVDLVGLVGELQPELAGVEGVDDDLGVVRCVGCKDFAALPVSTWMHDLDVVLRDVDLQVTRVRVVLVSVVAHREAAGAGGYEILQAHLGDRV